MITTIIIINRRIAIKMSKWIGIGWRNNFNISNINHYYQSNSMDSNKNRS